MASVPRVPASAFSNSIRENVKRAERERAARAAARAEREAAAASIVKAKEVAQEVARVEVAKEERRTESEIEALRERIAGVESSVTNLATNGGGGGRNGISYNVIRKLTPQQQAVAQANIGFTDDLIQAVESAAEELPAIQAVVANLPAIQAVPGKAAEVEAGRAAVAADKAAVLQTKTEIVAIGEAKLSFKTKAAADAALATIAENANVYINSSDANAGLWVKRNGVLERDSTATVPALDTRVNAEVNARTSLVAEGFQRTGTNPIAKFFADDFNFVTRDEYLGGGVRGPTLDRDTPTSPTGIVHGDEQGFIYSEATETGTYLGGRRIDVDPATVVAPAEPVPLMGPVLYGGNGRPIRLYSANLVDDRAALSGTSIRLGAASTDANQPLGLSFGENGVSFDPAAVPGTALELRMSRAGADTVRRRSMTLRRATLSGSRSVSILALGDSITNRNLLLYINTLLAAWGITPSWIGTMPSSAAGSSTDATGPLGEGRESWAYTDWIYSVLDGEAQPLPVGQESAYLAMTKAQRLAYNPAIRPAVGSDPAGKVFNGYVFDFGFYLSRFALATPAIVLEGLWTNDRLEAGTVAAALANMATAQTIIYDAIRSAAPSARILKWLPAIPRGLASDATWAAAQAPAIAASIATIAARADPLIEFVNAHAVQSPDDGWPLGVTATSASGVETGTVSDPVHPATIGRQQLAEQLALAIAYYAA